MTTCLSQRGEEADDDGSRTRRTRAGNRECGEPHVFLSESLALLARDSLNAICRSKDTGGIGTVPFGCMPSVAGRRGFGDSGIARPMLKNTLSHRSGADCKTAKAEDPVIQRASDCEREHHVLAL